MSKKGMLTSKISDKRESRRAAIVTPLGKLKPGQDIFILIDKDNQEGLGHDGEILRANILHVVNMAHKPLGNLLKQVILKIDTKSGELQYAEAHLDETHFFQIKDPSAIEPLAQHVIDAIVKSRPPFFKLLDPEEVTQFLSDQESISVESEKDDEAQEKEEDIQGEMDDAREDIQEEMNEAREETNVTPANDDKNP